MRRLIAILLPCLLAGGAAAEDLAEFLPTSRDVGSRWSVVEEEVPDPSSDPDLVSWGVTDQRTRHYTRAPQGGVEVCSIELWRFSTEGRARIAYSRIHHAGWRIDRRGDVLVMLRGLRRSRDGRSRGGVFPDCRRLGDQALERAGAPG